MGRKIALWSLWAGFMAYILLLAPPFHLQETLKLLKIAYLCWRPPLRGTSMEAETT